MAELSPAETAALDLIRHHNAGELPIDVKAIAEAEGAELVYEGFTGDVSGMLLRDKGRTVIAVNESHTDERQRFTIAHELGHMLLHEGRPLIVDSSIRVNLRDGKSSQATSRQEINANKFAAQLLMPSPLLREEVERLVGEKPGITDEQLVNSLAKLFAVSAQAMTFRLVNAGMLSQLAVGR
jgi:Zn-dependent peptidase ImmA (M78 family)